MPGEELPERRAAPVRLTGPLTVAAGLLLGAVSVSQGLYLSGLIARIRSRSTHAEMRGLTAAMRWRLERDLSLLDHNAPSAERALAEMVEDSGAASWAALYAGDGSVVASTGQVPPLPPERVRSTVAAPRELLPAVQPGEGGALVGLSRLKVGERQLVLVAGFPRRPERLSVTLWAFLTGSLFAGLFGSLLLVGHGAAATAAARRQRRSPPGAG